MLPRRMVMGLLCLEALAALTCPLCLAEDSNADLEQIFTAERLMPQGETYEREVPDTLDLAERARLSVRGLTRFLNPLQDYAPFGQCYLNTDPAYMTQVNGSPGMPNWGKISDALILSRLMCGSDENLDIEAGTIKGMTRYLRRKELVGWGGTVPTMLTSWDITIPTYPALSELQILDPRKLEAVSKAEPVLARRNTQTDQQLPLKDVTVQEPIKPVQEDADDVCDRNVGAFLSDAGWPTHIPKLRLLWTICCTGNCTTAMYFAWEAIVQGQGQSAQVNLLLNRASPWLDLDSYLPYEGKVVIDNKTARYLSVRIPLWVDRSSLKATVNDREARTFWTGSYLVFSDLKPKDRIVIAFPMVETRETYALNTVVDVSPRGGGRRLSALRERGHEARPGADEDGAPICQLKSRALVNRLLPECAW